MSHKGKINHLDRVLVNVLLAEYFSSARQKTKDDVRPRLIDLVRGLIKGKPPSARERLRRSIKKIRDELPPRAPPPLQAWLEQAVLLPALQKWARSVVSLLAPKQIDGDLE